jgi:hypothetical protein
VIKFDHLLSGEMEHSADPADAGRFRKRHLQSLKVVSLHCAVDHEIAFSFGGFDEIGVLDEDGKEPA